jgi:hypothetical protein
MDASHDNSRHHDDTNPNCMMVSVAGLSKAVNIVFDDVLVKADDQYHITHNVISFHDTGARKAAATSCAFWLILADLIWRIA